MPTQQTIRARRCRQGFTLIELLVTVAILGILMALAVPAYFDSIRKGRRGDAVAALSAAQQAQERWRANNSSYSADLSALGVGSASSAGYYTLAASDTSAAGYTLTATAVSGKSQANDTACLAMRVALSGGNVAYSSRCASCEAFTTTDNQGCWKR